LQEGAKTGAEMRQFWFHELFTYVSAAGDKRSEEVIATKGTRKTQKGFLRVEPRGIAALQHYVLPFNQKKGIGVNRLIIG